MLSCSSLLLEEGKISELDINIPKKNNIIYFEKEFLFNDDSSLSIKTHKIIKAGDNYNSLNPYISTVDNSINKLNKFEARVYHKNKNIRETFKISDLSRISLSSKQAIVDQDYKYVFLKEDINKGDLIETVSIHKKQFGPLGVNFSLNEVGEIANNIICTFIINSSDNLNYKVINDSLIPDVRIKEGQKIYIFNWKNYKPNYPESIFEGREIGIKILASFPSQFENKSWVNFAKWYEQLIKTKLIYDNHIKNEAIRITDGISGSKEKMQAIFKYCQDNFRYEQVYLEHGEFIPNNVVDIFQKKYADCKDYSTLIYAMAKSVNLNPKLALCYRGRGVKFFEDVAVNQFNHVIVYHRFNDEIYWYDATNRKGKAGITSFDLVNQKALIIDGDESRIVTIEESLENEINVNGVFTNDGNDLKTTYDIKVTGQYAIDLIYLVTRINEIKVKEILINWFKENISQQLFIENINWESNIDDFKITVTGVFKKGLLIVDGKVYLNIKKYFDNILKERQFDNIVDKNIFYNPDYSKISLYLKFENFSLTPKQPEPFYYKYHINLDQGPFLEEESVKFTNKYKYHLINLSTNYILFRI
jgi:hypothetical protein